MLDKEVQSLKNRMLLNDRVPYAVEALLGEVPPLQRENDTLVATVELADGTEVHVAGRTPQECMWLLLRAVCNAALREPAPRVV